MKCISLGFILTIVEIYISTATEILYVLPDNSTNVTSCPSQLCATLSQYLLDNGTLPVVSNVEYHFSPGEHHVPANMILQNLHNFSIIGAVSNSSSPVVLVGCLQPYVINIINSCFVIITNVVIKHCSILSNNRTSLYNLKMSCCFSCKLENVTFLQYGLTAMSLIGESYLHNIKLEIMQFPEFCCQAILIQYMYTTCPSWNSHIRHTDNVTINQLFIQNYIKYNPYVYSNVGLYVDLDYAVYNVKILLMNSHFYNMDRTALYIESRCFPTIKRIIFIKNCTFELINANPAIQILASPVNQIISFTNSKFHRNEKDLIRVDVSIPPYNTFACTLVKYSHQEFLLTAINISFIKCQFSSNRQKLLTLENKLVALDHVNVLFKSINILHNSYSRFNKIQYDDIISMTNVNIHISGPVNVVENHAFLSIMRFQSCDILFSGKITFHKNYCNQVISIDNHIKVMEYTNITFINNNYFSKLITIESTEYNYQPYPFCLFQYITMISSTMEELLPHYIIIANHNYLIDRTGNRLPSQNNLCSISFCHFTTHCKWVPQAAFCDHRPEDVNKQIIQNDDQNCNYHKHICYCSKSKGINCSVDILGSVYPGQILQTNLCNMCDNDNITVLYAEVHNVNLPSTTCKIAHQSQLINVIGNHSNTVNYTIVLSTPDIYTCEIFLTASPFLNKIYDAFYVQLLPCPIGFTLQDGVCDCDPILPQKFEKCYIDLAAIRSPANTWIIAHDHSQLQGNDTKYLISDCHMDYCLPYSSNVNLLHPDLQCQFNRTGILCSQCQHHLSMVFGSSRCMKCTNLHIILITIIVIVAGIILVILLYLLNLTVTNGGITGIIFYANIISINDSVFLVNDNVFKPLRVFISFVNLDLGIETCFYNGMDSYAKTWLLLIFPCYLIIIAASIIIASRYSYRILRLTYTRSLPVLATLFLLSYTGVLRTVLTVLFSYSTITHLPSGHQQVVWSIDASIPLFGVKFTILFIICLVLFLLLIPFNIILLFTRYLLQFRFINRFKPLLDAFQGSCKDKYYYWVAIHITLRSIYFALYGFQPKIRIIIATMILIFFTGYHGYIHPNKSKMVNIQELSLLINLTILYAVSYHDSKNVFSTVTNVMISLAFIKFCIIVLYHFLTYTCHCNVVTILQMGRQKILKHCSKKKECRLQNAELLNIPECTYNYTKFQDELVTDDFQ